MRTKLSMTKSAIARRKMRREQSPKEREARLAKRRETMRKWRLFCKRVNERN